MLFALEREIGCPWWPGWEGGSLLTDSLVLCEFCTMCCYQFQMCDIVAYKAAVFEQLFLCF